MAPEVIQRSSYDFRADIWSLGITIIEMAIGNPPFANEDPRRAIFLIPRTKPAKLEGKYSASLKEFLGFCLREEPDDRPTSEELLKTKFIKNSPKGTSILLDLISRHENWKLTKNDESDDDLLKLDEDENESETNEEEDEWIFDETIKSFSEINNSNADEEEENMTKLHGRSKSLFDQMELSEADGTVREIKNKSKEDSDEITKAVIEKMKLDKSWYNSKGIDTSAIANEKYRDIINSIPIKSNKYSNDDKNVQSSLENSKLSDNNNNNNSNSNSNNNSNDNNNNNNNNSNIAEDDLDHDNCKTISQKNKNGTPNISQNGQNNDVSDMNNLINSNINNGVEDDDETDESYEDEIDDESNESDYESIELSKKGLGIKKLNINPAMLDQDSYSNIQCYSPVYSIKSFNFNNIGNDNANTVKNHNSNHNSNSSSNSNSNSTSNSTNNINNNNNNNNINTNNNSNINNNDNIIKSKTDINIPQMTVSDTSNKSHLTHNVKQPSISSVQQSFTPLLTLSSPMAPSISNSTSSSPSNNADAIKPHSVQTSPFLVNTPQQHPPTTRTSISAPSTTTSTPITINVKKNLQTPSVLFQNKNPKLISNTNVNSNVNNGKMKGVTNQLPLILNTRNNNNIRKKTIESHSTPNIKGMVRKLSLNPVDRHNSKDLPIRPVSPYKTHYYSISCPQNNNFKKNFVNVNDLFEKASQQTSFDNINDKTNMKIRKSVNNNNKKLISVNNLHLYEKDALEKEINEMISETIQCLDAYHTLFSDVMIPSHEKNDS